MNNNASEKECQDLISWRTNEKNPCSIFGLPYFDYAGHIKYNSSKSLAAIRYTEKDIDVETLVSTNPLILPALLTKKLIQHENPTTLLKQKIIGYPKLFQHLPADLKKDPFFIIATLAQDRSYEMRAQINFKALDPAFCFALGEQWPELAFTVEQALRRDAPPYNNFFGYVGFRNSIIATIIFLVIGLLTIHFWPLIAASSTLLSLTAIFGMALVPVGIILPPMIIGMYLVKTYPETKKINHILTENNFFKPATSEPIVTDNSTLAMELV